MLDRDAAKGHAPLAEFCCGPCALDPSAMEVNGAAALFYRGGTVEVGGSPSPILILMLDQQGVLLGIACMTTEDQQLANAVFVQAYGREKRLKGRLLADEMTTLGDALLRACLEVGIHAASGATPQAYALTHYDNSRSHKALRRLGFDLSPSVKVQGPHGGWHNRYDPVPGEPFIHPQQLWHRPADLALTPLPAEVYVGPTL